LPSWIVIFVDESIWASELMVTFERAFYRVDLLPSLAPLEWSKTSASLTAVSYASLISSW
jgi:fibronectin type 3 domain-containing protein